MNDPIRDYLNANRDRFTPDALRRGLLDAGYDPAEVDAALSEWANQGAHPGDREEDQRSFRRWSLLIYVAALVAVVLLTVLMNGTESTGLPLIGGAVLVLVFFMLVAGLVSNLFGGWLAPRTGLGVALLVPLIFALGLGGTCLTIMDGMSPPRPTSGTVELRIDPPLSFSGSGAAACFVELDGRSSSINAEDLGTLDGRRVGLSLDGFRVTSQPAASDAEPAQGPDAPSLFVTFSPTSETEPGFGYSTIFNSRLVFGNSADGRSGTVTFEGLAAEPGGEPGSEQPEIGDPMSGTLTWTCEARR